MVSNKRLLVILGPTSTGKTDLALHLAEKFSGEIISADSRQVYKKLDIGTGKLPSGNNGQLTIENGKIRKGQGYWEINGIRIWMYDVVDPNIQYTVADYVKDATKAIDNILKRNKLPIIVGGTGFYMKVLLEGLPSLAIPMDKNLRKSLQKLSRKELQVKLQQISPDKWNILNESDRQNPRRLVRAIEILTSNINITTVGLMSKERRAKTQDNILKIGLTSSREILYQRSDARVVHRIKQGMIKEAKELMGNGITLKRMRQLGLEYGVLADFLDGKIKTEKDLIKILQFKIHGYIRRQLTWFKTPMTYSGYINWFDITDMKTSYKIEMLVRKWYDLP